MEDSSVNLKSPISPVLFTWVPPHNSTEKLSPKDRTLTLSPYFSPKKAIAPFFSACFFDITSVMAKEFFLISVLIISSKFLISSGESSLE